MSIAYDIPKYIRFFQGLEPFLRDTLCFKETEKIIAQRLSRREDNFLELLRESVFNNSKGFFFRLFKISKYAYDDVERIVRREGLETALKIFKEDGIFVTIEELKGRIPVKRKGESLSFKSSDSINPLILSSYKIRSSGTRSKGTLVHMDFRSLINRSVYYPSMIRMHGLENATLGMWFPVPPLGVGILSFLQFAKSGKFISKWFTPTRLTLSRRFGLKVMSDIVREIGQEFPFPEYANVADIKKVIDWIIKARDNKPDLLFLTFPSLAVRICEEARRGSLDISGIKFWLVGEPISEAKHKTISSAACSVIPVYAFMETGLAGFGCSGRQCCDEIHLASDIIALIQHQKYIRSLDSSMDVFLFTSISPASPRILINSENGDYGRIKEDECGCLLSGLGLKTSISNIRSFEKLTAQGVTFYIGDLSDLLEDEFPKKFGGGPLDYQLVEEEIGNKTRFSLWINPDVGDIDEHALRQAITARLRKRALHGEHQVELLNVAETLEIKRKEPIYTKAGKTYPLGISR